jgi:DNA-binding CsgD family transcriptional regulator
VDEAMVDRASRITPQEWRVIALAIEGVAPSAACEALGIALGTLESHKQAIRRKLGIPKGVRFEAYVRENFAEGVPIPEKQTTQREPRVVDKATQDRRVRWLLRITLQELSEVSVSAGLRAQLLEQTVARMNPSATAEAAREVQDLQQIAKEAQALFDKVLADIRARGAEPGSVGQ